MKDFCEKPYIMVENGLSLKNKGKKAYKFYPRGYSIQLERKLREQGVNYILIPCGHCYYCKMSYQRQWLQRMYCESKYHNCAWFITLTYANAPRFLIKSDLQKFMKRLRKHFAPLHLVFFANGEYGSLGKRPHYHLIVFDLPLNDLELASNGTHTSETIRKIWNKGIVQVDEAELGSFCYVAGYSAKKSPEANQEYIEFMRQFPRKVRPFCLMSKKIGYRYFMDNYQDIYNTDSVIISNHKSVYATTPCRYFDNMMAKFNANWFGEIKDARKVNSEFSNYHKFLLNNRQIKEIYHNRSTIHENKTNAKRFSL